MYLYACILFIFWINIIDNTYGVMLLRILFHEILCQRNSNLCTNYELLTPAKLKDYTVFGNTLGSWRIRRKAWELQEYKNYMDVSVCPAYLQRTNYLFTYNNTCLQIVTRSKRWTDARKDCQSRGGDLVQITSAAKQTSIMTQLQRLFPKKVWIGATDKDKEGKWIWVSGEVLNGHYGNWKSGQGPSQKGFFFSSGMLEDCALLDYSDKGRWHDYMCNSIFHMFPYICQYNQNSTLPSVLKPRTSSFSIVSTKLSTKTAKFQMITTTPLKHRITPTVPKTKIIRTTVKPTLPTTTSVRQNSLAALSKKQQGKASTNATVVSKTTTSVKTNQQTSTKKTTQKQGKISTSRKLSTATRKHTQTLIYSTKQTVSRDIFDNPRHAKNVQARRNNDKTIKGWVIGVVVGTVALMVVMVVTAGACRMRRKRIEERSKGIDNPTYGVTNSVNVTQDKY